MNLRQIVRNQKLQNYSLYGVIGEAKDDDEAAAVDADAGVTPAGSKKFWFTNNDGDYIDRVEDPGAGWRLADKNDAEKSVKKLVIISVESSTAFNITGSMTFSSN